MKKELIVIIVIKRMRDVLELPTVAHLVNMRVENIGISCALALVVVWGINVVDLKTRKDFLNIMKN